MATLARVAVTKQVRENDIHGRVTTFSYGVTERHNIHVSQYHVIVQRAICTTQADLDELVQAIKQAGVLYKRIALKK